MDYLHNTGLDHILDDMEKTPTELWHDRHKHLIKKYHNEPRFHAVVSHIIGTNRDGRFTLPEWQDALVLATALETPISALQHPNPPRPTPEAETPRKTAPGG